MIMALNGVQNSAYNPLLFSNRNHSLLRMLLRLHTVSRGSKVFAFYLFDMTLSAAA